MNTLLAASVLLLAGQGTPSPAPIGLNFSDTEVSQIFRAVGRQTGTNILYAGGDKLAITIHFTADSVEEAVRGIAASAGLSYRKVGRNYVVAKPDAMRQALAPFTRRARLRSSGLIDLEAYFAKVLPNLTVVSTAGGNVEVMGIQEDLDGAKELLDNLGADLEKTRGDEMRRGAIVTDVVNLRLADPKGIMQILTQLWPNVRAVSLGGPTLATPPQRSDTALAPGTDPQNPAVPQPTGPVNASGEAKGGTITLIGHAADVAAAKAKAKELDALVSSLGGDLTIATYDIRYGSPRSIVAFLAQMAPEVQVSLAPTTFIPSALTSSAGGPIANGVVNQSATVTNDQLNGLGQKPVDPTSGGNGSTGPTRTSTEFDAGADRAKRLVLKGNPDDVAAALKMLKKVDTAPRQVLVEVRVVDTSPEFAEQIGLKYNFGTIGFRELPQGLYKDPKLADTMQNTLRASGLGTLNRLPFSLDALLQAQTVSTSFKILAKPSIQVIDNEEANFFIGDTVNYPAPTSGALGSQGVQVLTFNVGIGLRVRPRVNADGNVTMQVNPVVSTITGIVNGLPQTSSREATTTVMVKDGETLMLGGLIRDEDRKTVTEVPILGRIPILGQLFRHTDRDHRKSTVIVSITPHLVPVTEEP